MVSRCHLRDFTAVDAVGGSQDLEGGDQNAATGEVTIVVEGTLPWVQGYVSRWAAHDAGVVLYTGGTGHEQGKDQPLHLHRFGPLARDLS